MLVGAAENPLIKSFTCQGKEDGKVYYPRGVISQDNIWIVDSENNRIQKFSL